jgi:hypothetical protein
MLKYLKLSDFSSDDKRSDFFDDVNVIAQNLLNQKSPFRKNLKVDYLVADRMPIYSFGDKTKDMRVKSGLYSSVDKFDEGEYIFAPTFQIEVTFDQKETETHSKVLAQNIVDAICKKEQKLYDEMISLNCRGGFFPIRQDLTVIGSSFVDAHNGCIAYEDVGIVMPFCENMHIYFLREKIKTLKKLLEIPELFNEVYYAHKNKFVELLRKI